MVKRFYWINKTYGGQQYLFINTNYNVIVEGNTASCKNSMYCDDDNKVKRLKDLKEIKQTYINNDFKLLHNKDLSYKALQILKNEIIDNTLSINDILNLKDN